MKFHEIIPGLLAGKKYRRQDWKDATDHIYADVHDDGSYNICEVHHYTVDEEEIGNWLTDGYDEWGEYKEYPKDLDFVEACRLARDNDAIISTTGRVKYYWYNSMLCECSTSKPFEPDLFIFHRWHVVGYKGE